MIADERIKEIWSSIDFDNPLEGRLNRFCRSIELEVNQNLEIRLDREYRNGFREGWNAGVVGDESLLASISNRVGKKSEYAISSDTPSTNCAISEVTGNACSAITNPNNMSKEIKQLKEQRDELLEALGSIAEYWNQDQNHDAMADACWHAINTAQDAIAKATSK